MPLQSMKRNYATRTWLRLKRIIMIVVWWWLNKFALSRYHNSNTFGHCHVIVTSLSRHCERVSSKLIKKNISLSLICSFSGEFSVNSRSFFPNLHDSYSFCKPQDKIIKKLSCAIAGN